MNSILLYGLAALIGAIVHRIIFGVEGAFEATIMHSLRIGKRVVLAINNDGYVFEMINGRLCITRAEAMFFNEEGEEQHEPNPFSLVPNLPDQPDDDSNSSISDT